MALLAHFWGQETASIDPFPIGVGLPTLSVSGSYLSVSRLQESSVATLGHLVGFLGAKMVHDGLKVANDGLKMAKEDSKMAQDPLRRLQDGSEMARHRLLGQFWAILGRSWVILVRFLADKLPLQHFADWFRHLRRAI